MSVLSSVLRLKTIVPVAALALGLASAPALAQHGGGHGGGGGGGGHAGGGGFHGGGFHGGGGWHGGWGRGWGRGWGWGGWGFYGGFYPWYGYGGWGWDPFWAYDYDAYPYYAAPLDYAPGPGGYPAPDGYSAPGGYPAPQGYGDQQYYPPAAGPRGMPTDNSRGFYTWQLGVEGGTCNRAELQRFAVNLTGAQPASLQAGAVLGGIPVQPVIGGRIGPRLDLTDQACATEALEHAPIGTTVRWETASGIPVSIRITKTTENQNGQCRGFEATAQFASHPDTVRNTACKGQDGAWRTTR